MDGQKTSAPEPRVRLDPDGLICADFTGNARITVDAVKSINQQHRALCPDRKCPVLILGERVGQVDYGAQRFASSPEVCELVSAMAFVTHSFLQRHLARMFLMYHRPPYPVQVFANEPSARAWLKNKCPTLA